MSEEPNEEPEVRQITPFFRMDRGYDSVDPADPNRIVFEDYSLRVLPADAPDETVEDLQPAPKDLSAPALAPSSASLQKSVPKKSVENVPQDESTESILATPKLQPSTAAEPESGNPSQINTG